MRFIACAIAPVWLNELSPFRNAFNQIDYAAEIQRQFKRCVLGNRCKLESNNAILCLALSFLNAWSAMVCSILLNKLSPMFPMNLWKVLVFFEARRKLCRILFHELENLNFQENLRCP
jgi:hypothetical protein